MDLNPVFTSSTAFRPSGIGGGELKLFEYVDIKLVHGWLVDPDSQEASALSRAPNYDAAVELIAEVDHLTNGKFVVEEASGDAAGSSMQASASSSSGVVSPTVNFTEEQQRKIADGESITLSKLPNILNHLSNRNPRIPRPFTITIDLPRPVPTRIYTSHKHPCCSLPKLTSLRPPQSGRSQHWPFPLYPRHRPGLLARIICCLGEIRRRRWRVVDVCRFEIR